MLQNHQPTFDCCSPVRPPFPSKKNKFFFSDSHPTFGSEKKKQDGPKGLPPSQAERLCDPCQVPWREVAKAGAVLWGTCNRARFLGASCGGLVGLRPGRPVHRSRARFPGANARARPIGVVCPYRRPEHTTPQTAGARGGLAGRSNGHRWSGLVGQGSAAAQRGLPTKPWQAAAPGGGNTLSCRRAAARATKNHTIVCWRDQRSSRHQATSSGFCSYRRRRRVGRPSVQPLLMS